MIGQEEEQAIISCLVDDSVEQSEELMNIEQGV